MVIDDGLPVRDSEPSMKWPVMRSLLTQADLGCTAARCPFRRLLSVEPDRTCPPSLSIPKEYLDRSLMGVGQPARLKEIGVELTLSAGAGVGASWGWG